MSKRDRYIAMMTYINIIEKKGIFAFFARPLSRYVPLDVHGIRAHNT